VDGDRDGGRRRVGPAVAGLVGEAVEPGVAGRGRVGEGAVGIEGHGAVGRVGELDGAEHVVDVGVGVVAQDPGRGNRQGRVLIGRVRVTGGRRGLVEVDGEQLPVDEYVPRREHEAVAHGNGA